LCGLPSGQAEAYFGKLLVDEYSLRQQSCGRQMSLVPTSPKAAEMSKELGKAQQEKVYLMHLISGDFVKSETCLGGLLLGV